MALVLAMGLEGYVIADIQNLALRGDKAKALAALRAAAEVGWRRNSQAPRCRGGRY